LHWMDERLKLSSMRHPKFGKCCLQGKIQLPRLQDPPQPLKHLLESKDDPVAKKFRENIRQYNFALSFTSLGVKLDRTVLDGHGPYVLHIQGELYHQTGHAVWT
jgi:hypothetical protein